MPAKKTTKKTTKKPTKKTTKKSTKKTTRKPTKTRVIREVVHVPFTPWGIRDPRWDPRFIDPILMYNHPAYTRFATGARGSTGPQGPAGPPGPPGPSIPIPSPRPGNMEIPAFKGKKTEKDPMRFANNRRSL